MQNDRDPNMTGGHHVKITDTPSTHTEMPMSTSHTDLNTGMSPNTSMDSSLDRPAHRSNAMAYIIGGLIIALGLLAFLVYGGMDDGPGATGSTTAGDTSYETGSRGPTPNAGSTGAAPVPTAPPTPAPGTRGP